MRERKEKKMRENKEKEMKVCGERCVEKYLTHIRLTTNKLIISNFQNFIYFYFILFCLKKLLF